MVLGINGTPAAELLHNSTALSQGIQRVYGLVTAQEISFAARVNVSTNGTARKSPVLQGQLQNSSVTRLQQNKTNTRVLQALLAAMAISGFIGVLLMPKASRILPKNPHSVAATWSLLAGSKMMEEDVIPPGSEWCDDKELDARGVFSGRTFTLGWWTNETEDGEEEGVRSFRIDVDS